MFGRQPRRTHIPLPEQPGQLPLPQSRLRISEVDRAIQSVFDGERKSAELQGLTIRAEGRDIVITRTGLLSLELERWLQCKARRSPSIIYRHAKWER